LLSVRSTFLLYFDKNIFLLLAMHITPLALGTTSCLLKDALETNYSLHEFSPFFHKLDIRLSASAFVVSVVQNLTNF
jgi:hypothetical protein